MNTKNKETKLCKRMSKEALWKRQQMSRQNEENEKRDKIRKQTKLRVKTFREETGRVGIKRKVNKQFLELNNEA